MIFVCLVIAAADAVSLYREEKAFDEIWRQAYRMPKEAKRNRDEAGGVDLDALRALNPQCVGYISIKDTPLSYPVMQTDEEGGMFYLTHAFDRSYHGNGTPFLDMRCDIEKPSDNLIVYGHNTRNTNMFSCLRFYQEREYFEDYQIFAVLFSSLSEQENRDIFQMIERDPEEPEQWEKFLEYLARHSLYDTGVKAETEDRILTLSTCYRPIDNGRVLVFAKKIEN